jgi:DNA-binding Lrp family transcriptional regulator
MNGKSKSNSDALYKSKELLEIGAFQENENQEKNGQQDRKQEPEDKEVHLVTLLNKTNKEIISMLEEDAFQSQTEIAKKLGLSQSSIALRLDRLRRSGIIRDVVGVHLKKLGVELCRADVNCSDPRSVLEWSKSCPLNLNGAIGVGGINVSLYFAAEDMETFQYIIDEHVRRLPGVKEVHFAPIVSWSREYVAPIKLEVSRSTSPPCGMLPYCPRCPANPDYDGKVWNGRRKD